MVLLVDFNLLHLLLDLLQLHLLVAVLTQLLYLGHPHGRLLLLVVVVGVDGIALGRVGTVLRLRTVEGHYRVFDVLLGLLRNEARIEKQRWVLLSRTKILLTSNCRCWDGLFLRARGVGKGGESRCPRFNGGDRGRGTLKRSHQVKDIL